MQTLKMKDMVFRPVLVAILISIPVITTGQGENQAFQSNYRELGGLPRAVLIAELDEQIDWLLRVDAAAPPDLSYKIEQIKTTIFAALRRDFCSAGSAAATSLQVRRDAAIQSLVAAMSPASVGTPDRGAIAATIVRIAEHDAELFCI